MHSEIYPLTFPQQAIFLDAQLHGPTTKFNMGGGIVIRGWLDPGIFRRAVRFAFQQHDAERLRIHVDGGEPRQQFLAAAEYDCATMDFSGRTEPFRSAIEWLLADIARPMRRPVSALRRRALPARR